MKLQVSPLLLAAALAGYLLQVSAPALAQRDIDRPVTPGDGASARAPIPPGVPTTPDNVYLPTESEVKSGRNEALQVERQYRLIRSGPQYDRLQRVAREVVKQFQRPDIIAEYVREHHLEQPSDHSRRVPFDWTFKLLRMPREVNAFTIAGGTVYVSDALLDYTSSDDELAAVLAHECTHAAFHHTAEIGKKGKKVTTAALLAMLAGMAAMMAGGGRSGSNPGALVVAGSQYVAIATMSGYERPLEAEADRVGVEALAGSKYNPVAMLTFMQKLAQLDQLHGNFDPGIYQDHPYTTERIEAIRQELVRLGYSVAPGAQRRVDGSFDLRVVAREINGAPGAELRLNDRTFFLVAAGENGMTPLERARQISRRLQDVFIAQNAQPNDMVFSADNRDVTVKGIRILHVYPEDAAAGGGAGKVTRTINAGIVAAFWKEKISSRG